MDSIVNVHEAKTHLSRLLDRVAAGEEITIAKAGRPVAKLSGFQGRQLPRKPGSAKDKITLGPDFDAPLPGEISRSFA